MPRLNPEDRIKNLRQKQAEIMAQLKALEARETRKARKDDTRRKIIAGALALEHFNANPESEFARVMRRLLREYVMRPADRALFPNLPPLPARTEKTADA